MDFKEPFFILRPQLHKVEAAGRLRVLKDVKEKILFFCYASSPAWPECFEECVDVVRSDLDSHVERELLGHFRCGCADKVGKLG